MRDRTERLAGPIGALTAIGVAGLCVHVRSSLGSTNVALILVLVIAAAAAMGGRSAGVLTSVVAALSFNYFHTGPYYSLRIANRVDIITTLLLALVGLAVGELAALRLRSRRSEVHAVRAAGHLEATAAAIAAGRDMATVWPLVQAGLVSQLHLRDATYQPAPVPIDELPRIQRDGRLPATEHFFTEDGFALPPDGVELIVGPDHDPVGRVVLVPEPGSGATRADRRAAVALADQLAIVAKRPGRFR